MKKTLLAGILAIGLLSSCSDDDENTNTAPQELAQLKQTYYSHHPVDPFDPDSETYTTIVQVNVTEFEEGKPVMSSYYNQGGNNLNSQDVYEYNEQGLLVTRTMHHFATSEDYITNYSYDALGRLTEITQSSPTANPFSITTFTYNPDNTITSLRTIVPDNDQTVTTFYLNENDMIYKEESEGMTTNYNLNGYDTMGVTFQSQNFSQFINYTYDNEHDPSLLNLQSITGSYVANQRLIRNYLYYVSETDMVISSKYLLQQDRGGYDIIDFVYTFNESGLPVLKKGYHMDTHTMDYEYIYE
jgi:hypothetical protein